MIDCAWALQTPAGDDGAGGRGAIAVIRLSGDVGAALAAIGVAPVAPGGVGLRSIAGIDEGVVARFGEGTAFVMPHAGPAVVRAIVDALVRAGVREERGRGDAPEAYPEAADAIEARMLDALARAASPLAVDLLLDQPRRWRESGERSDRAPTARDRALNRLIEPPTVAAVGRPNIGKSSLLNALAGQRVAIVADEPGTTRDHVGVTLDLAGLVVRWLDTPGIDPGVPDPVQREAQSIALSAAGAADLVVLCGDPRTPPAEGLVEGRDAVRVLLRADLPGGEGWGPDARVSVRNGEGMPGLVALLKERLVPRSVLAGPGTWRFW